MKSIIDDLVVPCDEITGAAAKAFDEPITFN